MKKIRIPLLISIGIMVIGLILGSFFDLQISQTIFSPRNGFGVCVAAFAFIPAYGFIGLVSGILFANTYKSNKPKWLKVGLYIASVVALFAAAYFSTLDLFSVNGFDKPGIGYDILAIGIGLVINSGFAYLGYYLFKDNTNEYLWIPIMILVFAVFIALVPVTQILKVAMDRPRYRLIAGGVFDVPFYNWYQPCKNSQVYIDMGALKEDFKSMPSGHAGSSIIYSVILAIILPLARPNLRKYIRLLYFAAFAVALVVMFSRMLVGAHFLSDVSMGALINLLMVFIANEIIIRKNLFKLE